MAIWNIRALIKFPLPHEALKISTALATLHFYCPRLQGFVNRWLRVSLIDCRSVTAIWHELQLSISQMHQKHDPLLVVPYSIKTERKQWFVIKWGKMVNLIITKSTHCLTEISGRLSGFVCNGGRRPEAAVDAECLVSVTLFCLQLNSSTCISKLLLLEWTGTNWRLQ